MMYKESGKQVSGTRKRHNVVPTWNHLYTFRKGSIFLDKWALQHKAKIEILTRNWIEENKWEKTHDLKVFVDVWIYWPDAKARDCHNIDKLILDAFEDAEIYDNDANALLRYQDFDIDVEKPRIEVQFTVGKPFDRKSIAKGQRQNSSKNKADS